MRITNIVILLFILTALVIGVSMNESGIEKTVLDNALNNATSQIENVSLGNPDLINANIPNPNGALLVIEKGVQFIGILGVETMRAGISFGYDNPEYFSSDYIYGVIKLIIYLVIIAILIKPLVYVLVFVILFFIWVKDKLKIRRNKNETKN